MGRITIYIIVIMAFSITMSYAAEVDTSKNWGIGLYGNNMSLGGISIRYRGISPTYLQLFAHYIPDKSSYSIEQYNMIGFGVSRAIYEQLNRALTSFYVSLGCAGRYEKDAMKFNLPYGYKGWNYISVKNTYITGVTFGIEVVMVFFGLQMSCSGEIGGGIGIIRNKTLHLGYSAEYRTDFTGSPILGGGVHVYF